MKETEADRFLLLLRDRLRQPSAGGPPSRRLAAALRDLADAGALSPGGRLPSERDLAPAVGMSRGTVAAAYRSLVADGLCERRHGSGTYVAGGAAAAEDWVLGHLIRREPMLIDLSSGGQHGIDLAGRCVIQPGDRVLVEETTYPGALAVIRRHRARRKLITTR